MELKKLSKEIERLEEEVAKCYESNRWSKLREIESLLPKLYLKKHKLLLERNKGS